MLRMIAAFGIWPALPLTGYWLFALCFPPGFWGRFPAVTSLALMTVAGIAAWSVLMLTAAIAGVYSGSYLGLFGWVVTVFVLIGLLRQRNNLARSKIRLSAYEFMLLCGLVLAAGLYCAFPTESILVERDNGVYANHAIYIAHHGRLDVPYPFPNELSDLFKEATPTYQVVAGLTSSYFPGFYLTSPTITVQFGHLLPIWLAQAFSTLGRYGLFSLNAIFAILSLSVFYGICRSVVPEPYALVATLFLGLNPSELWIARTTLSEVLAQLFISSGLLLLLQALKQDDQWLARWAGIFIGFSAMTRVDSFFAVSLLFLSHLLARIVKGTRGRGSIGVWTALYQGAAPIFILALGYYALFSAPYFHDLSPSLKKIGLGTIGSLVVLLAATPRFLWLARPSLTSKRAVILVGLGLFALSGYAYWVRSDTFLYSIIPFRTMWLGDPGKLKAGYLVKLGQYLSAPVIWMGILGWFVTFWTLVRNARENHLTAILVVYGGFSILYLWNPFIRADHFWAIRRFIPVVIPGFVLFAAIGAKWILSCLPRGWSAIVASCLLAFLLVFTIEATGLILVFSENKGYFAQLDQMAEKLPRDNLLLAHGSPTWVAPLYIAFDRQVVHINLDDDKGKDAFNRWITRRIGENKPVYLLYEGELPLAGLQYMTVAKFTLSRSYPERTVSPLPKKILSEQKMITLYKIIGVPKELEYRQLNLGAAMVWGVEESGFYGQEWLAGRPFRWTNGAARLAVPVDGQPAPKALRVDLASTGPMGTRLKVLVNAYKLFDENVPGGAWSRTFTLASVPLDKLVTIELLSGTFVPREVMDTEDPRQLGILVQRIALLQSDQPLLGVPLSNEDYRSNIVLTEKREPLSITLGQQLPLRVTVRNRGAAPWPTFVDLGRDAGCVRLGIIWFMDSQADKRVGEQRQELPYTMLHGDQAEIDVALRPIGYDGKELPPGTYDVRIGMVQENVTWFYDKGDDVLKLIVQVEP
ncbi:hypothetical protein [Candidatus Methylomirabilis sp.]|uniref:hypothetical protein n=1 Tax=Candidatus Methylomirabilis sp. TaxID=2032687 RepID=UPI003075F354